MAGCASTLASIIVAMALRSMSIIPPPTSPIIIIIFSLVAPTISFPPTIFPLQNLPTVTQRLPTPRLPPPPIHHLLNPPPTPMPPIMLGFNMPVRIQKVRCETYAG